MTELILPAATLFRFNSEMLSVGLSGLSQEHAVRRIKDGEGSSIAYLVGHVTSSRYDLLKSLGADAGNPFADLYGAGVGSKDGAAYPPIAELRAKWDEVAAELDRALDAVTDEAARAPDDGGFPIADQTLRGRLTFVAWHESYHVGQVGILRTEMGYPSLRQMLYTVRKR